MGLSLVVVDGVPLLPDVECLVPVLFLTFREPAGGEVSVYFCFSYLVVYFVLLYSGA